MVRGTSGRGGHESKKVQQHSTITPPTLPAFGRKKHEGRNAVILHYVASLVWKVRDLFSKYKTKWAGETTQWGRGAHCTSLATWVRYS